MRCHIQVSIRMRPALVHQQSRPHTQLQLSSKSISISTANHQHKQYSFDQVFGPDIAQEQLFHTLKLDEITNRVLLGFNATVLAYGMTSSGKTYTMEGSGLVDGKEMGLIPRVSSMIFQQTLKLSKESTNGRAFNIKCSYLQLYNERIYDLFAKSTCMTSTNFNATGLKMRWDKVQQFNVQNLYIYQCHSAQDLIKRWQQAKRQKMMGVNKLNSESSRSHTIFSIIVQSWSPDSPMAVRISRIELVDLAGSQRSSYLSEDSCFKQSIEINKSLLTLRKVITCLSEKQGLPPFRESKLTSLIKHSLGGNAFCVIIACLNPLADFDHQNESTLKFATLASKIINSPVANENPLVRQIQDLKSQVQQLRKQNTLLKELSQKSTSKGQRLKTIDEQSQRNNIRQHYEKNYEYFGQRFMESIKTTRDLLQSNKILRNRIDVLKNELNTLVIQNNTLNQENQHLREKLYSFKDKFVLPPNPPIPPIHLPIPPTIPSTQTKTPIETLVSQPEATRSKLFKQPSTKKPIQYGRKTLRYPQNEKRFQSVGQRNERGEGDESLPCRGRRLASLISSHNTE